MTVLPGVEAGAGKWRGRFNQLLLVVLLNVPTVSFGLALGWVSLASGEAALDAGGAGGDVRVVAGAASTFLAELLGVPLGARALSAGRKFALIAASAAFAVCWTLKLVGVGWWVVVARVFAGLGGAAGWAAAPLMAKEACEARAGGAAVASMVLAHNVGFLLMYVAADIGMQHRTVVWWCLGLSVLHCLVFPFMPESPAFLAAQGRDKEARSALAWLRGAGPDAPELASELQALPAPDDLGASNPVTLVRAMLSDKRRRRAFLISFVAVVGQESCGVLALLQFAERLFVLARDEAGGEGGDGGAGGAAAAGGATPARYALVLGGAQLVASAAALYLVERVGRRRLIVSTAFVTVGCLALGAWLVTGGRHLAPWAALALGGAVAADSAGLQPAPWALLADMFTYQYRGCALVLVSAGASLGNALEVVVLPAATGRWGAGGGLALAAALTLLYATFAALAVPETRGLTPEQLYDLMYPSPAPPSPPPPDCVLTLKDKCSDMTECTYM